MKSWIENNWRGLLHIGLFTVLAVLILWANEVSIRSYDDTDNPPETSGMSLFTDFGTGCQYLSRGMTGPVTPRIGTDGKQICTGPKRKELHVQAIER